MVICAIEKKLDRRGVWDSVGWEARRGLTEMV